MCSIMILKKSLFLTTPVAVVDLGERQGRGVGGDAPLLILCEKKEKKFQKE